MALALSEEQLVNLNKKDILRLLFESMEQEKELSSQLTVLTDELKRTNRQMQVIHEKWNLAQTCAIAYSIAKTAKTNNLKPYQYFEYLLTELPEKVSEKKDRTFSLDNRKAHQRTI